MLANALRRKQARTSGVLYDNGTEYARWVPGYGDKTKAVKEPGFLSLQADGSHSAFVTGIPVDFSQLKSLNVDWQMDGIGNYNYAYLMFSTYPEGDHDAYDGRRAFIDWNNFRERLVTSIDVSSFTGNYYVRIQLRSMNSGNATMLKTFKVWGE